jgi:hypothetical protein
MMECPVFATYLTAEQLGVGASSGAWFYVRRIWIVHETVEVNVLQK